MACWFSFERPNLDLSGYGDGALIYWAERLTAGPTDEDISPNEDDSWDEDNGGELAYSGSPGGLNSLVPNLMYRSGSLLPFRNLTLNLRYNPVIAKGLNRDFMHHLGGDDAIASAAGNLSMSGLQLTVTHWFFGWIDDMPDGYTTVEPSYGGGPVVWVQAYKTDDPVTIASMALALMGVRLNEDGVFTHEIVFIGAAGASTEANVARPADIKDLVLAYLANKNSYMFFEIMPISPALIDLLTDPTPSKFRSYYDALANEDVTWELREPPGSPSNEWLAFGTVDISALSWSGIVLAGTHVNYSGDFPLPSEARVPPGGLPPMM